jgi:arsenite methyltransferase
MIFIIFITDIIAMEDNSARDFGLDTPEMTSAIDELSLWSAPFGLKLLDVIRIKPAMQVLDIGCGTGFPLIEIAMRLGPDSRVLGIDPWQAALERARFKIMQYKLTNVSLFRTVAENLPFFAGTFDLLVSNNGMNNVSNPDQAFHECFRVAKEGAQFVWTMNTDGSFSELYDVLGQLLNEMGMKDTIDRMEAHIYSKRRPLPEMEQKLTAAGFSIREIHSSLFKYRFANGTAMFRHAFIQLAFMESWKNIVSPASDLDIFQVVESRLNEIASVKGELQMQIPFVTFDCEKK